MQFSKRLVKQPYRSLSTPAQLFRSLFLSFSLSLFLSSLPQTPPNFSLCPIFPLVPHPRRESCTHDAMANGERKTHAPGVIFFLLLRYPHSILSLVRRGVAWWPGTGRWSKGVATGNANELHERRQIEQHTTMVSSCHPPACLRTLTLVPSTLRQNLIESWLCINTTAYVVIGECITKNKTLGVHQCVFWTIQRSLSVCDCSISI